MSYSTFALLEKVLRLLNHMPRYVSKRLGIDSYELAAEISRHLKEQRP